MKPTWLVVWMVGVLAWVIGQSSGLAIGMSRANTERGRASHAENEVRRLRSDLLQADARCRALEGGR